MNNTPFKQEQAYKAYAREVEDEMNLLGAPNTLSRSVVAGDREFIERAIANNREAKSTASILYQTYARR